jgi:hypothetical protein
MSGCSRILVCNELPETNEVFDRLGRVDQPH